ncbi:MAG TPA: hypothetical protein DCM08_03920, partial [Microscillaceae bacterium]|nr:hypothetical protein [Microscillaceae bacterium]
MQHETTFFDKGWVSFDLGKYRPCHGTYCFFDYDNLPPVDESLFTGNFQWMPLLPKRLQKAAEEDGQARIDSLIYWKNKITNLQQQAQTLGLILPESFVTWMTNPDFLDTVASLSCTACYFDLSETLIKLPFPEEDGHVVRFLNDQQDVICWYLYLHPQKSPLQLTSSLFYA